MRKLLAILLALPGVGCAYLGNRAADFADMWRLELSVGAGIQADVAAGEVAHLGVGSSRRWSGGLRYGEGVAERRVEDHFPLSYVWTLADPDLECVHSLKWGDSTTSQHNCYVIVPGEHGRHQFKKDVIHYYDVEVNVFAGIVGVQAGFSFGEFLDFLLGWFGADIAQDDGDRRATKRYWHPVEAPRPEERPRPAAVP